MAALKPLFCHRISLLRHWANRLISLICENPVFGKLQSVFWKIDVSDFDLRELVDSLTAKTNVDHPDIRFSVEVAVSPAVPNSLKGDPRRIRQILLKIIRDALKYCGESTVLLTVWSKPSLMPGTSVVVFAVSDDRSNKYFDKQSQLPAHHHQVKASTALLTKCRRISEKIGGHLWYQHEPGEDCTCYFEIPLQIGGAPAIGKNSSSGIPDPAKRRHPDFRPLDALSPDAFFPPTEPVDRLTNLRLLARRRNNLLKIELANYFTALTTELDHLSTALLEKKKPAATYYAHLLCGRFCFIYERELDQLSHQIEVIVTRGQWSDARERFEELLILKEALRLRIVASDLFAPPELVR